MIPLKSASASPSTSMAKTNYSSSRQLLKQLHDEKLLREQKRQEIAAEQLRKAQNEEKRFILVSEEVKAITPIDPHPRLQQRLRDRAREGIKELESLHDILVEKANRRKQEAVYDPAIEATCVRQDELKVQVEAVYGPAIEAARVKQDELEDLEAAIPIPIYDPELIFELRERLTVELQHIGEMIQQNALIPDESILSHEELESKENVVYEAVPQIAESAAVSAANVQNAEVKYLLNDDKTKCVRDWQKELSSKWNPQELSDSKVVKLYRKYIKMMRRILRDNYSLAPLVNTPFPTNLLPEFSKSNGCPLLGKCGNTLNRTTLASCRYGYDEDDPMRDKSPCNRDVPLSSFIDHPIADYMINWLRGADAMVNRLRKAAEKVNPLSEKKSPSPTPVCGWKDHLATLVKIRAINETEIKAFAARVEADENKLAENERRRQDREQQRQEKQQRQQEAELAAAAQYRQEFAERVELRGQQEEKDAEDEADLLTQMVTAGFAEFDAKIEDTHREGKAAFNAIKADSTANHAANMEQLKAIKKAFVDLDRLERKKIQDLNNGIAEADVHLEQQENVDDPERESPLVEALAEIGRQAADVMIGAFSELQKEQDSVMGGVEGRIDRVDTAGRAALEEIHEDTRALKTELQVLNTEINNNRTKVEDLKPLVADNGQGIKRLDAETTALEQAIERERKKSSSNLLKGIITVAAIIAVTLVLQEAGVFAMSKAGAAGAAGSSGSAGGVASIKFGPAGLSILF